MLSGKEHLDTIITYADLHGIKYDKLKSIYFQFVLLGYVWFMGNCIVSSHKLTFEERKKIEEFIEKEIIEEEVFIIKNFEEKIQSI